MSHTKFGDASTTLAALVFLLLLHNCHPGCGDHLDCSPHDYCDDTNTCWHPCTDCDYYDDPVDDVCPLCIEECQSHTDCGRGYCDDGNKCTGLCSDCSYYNDPVDGVCPPCSDDCDNTTQHTCYDGHCIPLEWRCNGEGDCGHEGSDDEDVMYCDDCEGHKDCNKDAYCDVTNNCRRSCTVCEHSDAVDGVCPSCTGACDDATEHTCNSRKCIPVESRCDGVRDCELVGTDDEDLIYCPELMIDNFETGFLESPGLKVLAGPTASPNNGFDAQTGSMMGGERDIRISARKVDDEGEEGSVTTLVQMNCSSTASSNVYGTWEFTWDGLDNSTNVSKTVLGDLTIYCRNGGKSALRVKYAEQSECHSLEVILSTNIKDVLVTMESPRRPGGGDDCIPRPGYGQVLLEEFVTQGADLADTRALQLKVDASRIADFHFIYDYVRLCCCENDEDCDDEDVFTVAICTDCLCEYSVAHYPSQTAAPTVNAPAPTPAPTVLMVVLEGNVWFDLNENGEPDDDELGIGEVKIKLLDDHNRDCIMDSTDPELNTTETDSVGSYSFGSHPASRAYILAVIKPTRQSFQESVNTTTTELCISGDGPEQGSGDENFGFVKRGTISGIVWHDANEDGQRNDGLPILVKLVDVPIRLITDINQNFLNDDGDIEYASITTDNEGGYVFRRMPPDWYIVAVVGEIGLTDYANTTQAELCVQILADEKIGSNDFGLIQTGSIGDLVWYDANNDGVHQSEETGIDSVTLSLYEDLDNNCKIDILSEYKTNTSTDPNGFYIFSSLLPNRRYLVQQLHSSCLHEGTLCMLTTYYNPICRYLNLGQDYLKADFGWTEFTTLAPTPPPVPVPTPAPTDVPTYTPTYGPTNSPTPTSTAGPTSAPTGTPTHAPLTLGATNTPTDVPTYGPTYPPTYTPTHVPTYGPATGLTTVAPVHTATTIGQIGIPTEAPGGTLTEPTIAPTLQLLPFPIFHPIPTPTNIPTLQQTLRPALSGEEETGEENYHSSASKSSIMKFVGLILFSISLAH